jgi:cysteine synthase
VLNPAALDVMRRAYGDVAVVEARTVTRDGAFSGAVPGVVAGYSRLLGGDAAPTGAVDVLDDEAIATARRLGRRGLPVGPSSGLNVAAARS